MTLIHNYFNKLGTLVRNVVLLISSLLTVLVLLTIIITPIVAALALSSWLPLLAYVGYVLAWPFFSLYSEFFSRLCDWE